MTRKKAVHPTCDLPLSIPTMSVNISSQKQEMSMKSCAHRIKRSTSPKIVKLEGFSTQGAAQRGRPKEFDHFFINLVTCLSRCCLLFAARLLLDSFCSIGGEKKKKNTHKEYPHREFKGSVGISFMFMCFFFSFLQVICCRRPILKIFNPSL